MRPATIVTTVQTPAGSTALTDLTTVKDELAIANTASDVFLTRQIANSSAAIQKYCGRIFAPQTIQDQIWLARDGWPPIVRGDVAPLQLSNWPTISVTSFVEAIAGVATTLVAGTDFLLEPEVSELTRLDTFGNPRFWRDSPIVVVYQAGFSTLPAEVAEAAILLVKMRWFGRQRDPLTRSKNVVGVMETSYVMGTGPGGADDMPSDVTALIDRYRMPVVG